jgi:hypothetical protein
VKKYFLSYSRNDQAIALRFAVDLKTAGVDVWVDQLDIPVGHNWDRAVEAAVRVCEGLIVVLSPHSVASENVADEVSVAIQDSKKIVPILIEKCAVPLRLHRVQYIDATADYQVALERCTRLILGAQVNTALVEDRVAAAISAPLAADAAPEPVIAPVGWSAQTLDDTVQKLLAFVGPVARLLVEKAALGTRSEAELYERLAVAIPNATERAAFLKSVNAPPAAQLRAHAVAGSPTPTPSGALPPELFDRICQILTVYIGPVARHVLVRDAREAKNHHDLYERLGAHIPTDKERAEFHAKLRSL